MAANLSVKVRGDLDVTASPGSCGPCGSQGGSASATFRLDFTSSAETEVSQQRVYVDAGGGAVALQVPQGIEGRVIYVRQLDPRSPMTLEIDYSTSGTASVPFRDVLLACADPSDHITGVRVADGAGTIAWMLAGDLP